MSLIVQVTIHVTDSYRVDIVLPILVREILAYFL